MIDRLERFPETIRAAVESAPEAMLRRKPAGGGFALVEHACHLADLEAEGFGVRIERLLREDDPFLPDFEGERIAEERGYLAQTAAEAVERFARARAANVARLRALTAEEWSRRGQQEGIGEITLRRVAELMAEHDSGHEAEICEFLEEEEQ